MFPALLIKWINPDKTLALLHQQLNKKKHQTKSAGQTAAFHKHICIIIMIIIIISSFGSAADILFNLKITN